jgi:hypothetical protein
LKEIGCMISDINNTDEKGLLFNLQARKNFSFQRYFYHGGIKSKQWVTVLLAFNEDGSDKLPYLVTGKYKKSTLV